MRVLNGNHLFEFGGFTLDAEKKVLRRDGEIVSLPLKAVELLCVLIENRGEVVGKNVLMAIQRRLDEAKTEMNLALELDPTNPTLLGNLYLNRINQPAVFSDKEAMLNQIELQAKNNSFTLPYINVDPLYNEVRDEPRFQTILRKINL